MRLRDLQALERVLVVKLSSFGDVVHVTPCLRAIRRSCPAAEIVMAVEPRFAAVVRHSPHVDLIVGPALAMGSPMAGLRQAARVLASATRRHPAPRARVPFDLAIDFQGLLRSAAWVYASQARVKAGRGRFRPGWQVAVRPDLGRHAVLVCAEVATRLGIEVADLDPEIVVGPEDDAQVERLLVRRGLPPEGFLLVNPFSRWPSKAWPPERYAELLRKLRPELGSPAVVAGGPEEARGAQALLSLLQPGTAVSLVGELALDQALALYRRAALMVTGDSGPMHAAAALRTRVVALFGPTLPERTGPWGNGHRVIHCLRPPSHHTYREPAAQRHMRAIDLETVRQAVLEAWRELDRPRAAAQIVAPPPAASPPT